MKVCVQHDDCKRDKEDSVLILKWTAPVVASVVFPVTLRKCGHDSINLLRLSRKAEPAVGEKMTKSELDR